MAIPKDRRLLALLIAVEWDSQDAMLKHHALPVVSPLEVHVLLRSANSQHSFFVLGFFYRRPLLRVLLMVSRAQKRAPKSRPT